MAVKNKTPFRPDLSAHFLMGRSHLPRDKTLAKNLSIKAAVKQRADAATVGSL
jgi:hypothetical protein